LEELRSTSRVKVYCLTLQERRKKTKLRTWSDKIWRISVERLKKFCLLNSSFFVLAEVIALKRFGGTEHESFLVCFRLRSGYLT